jgi:hypothetical protein
MKGFYRIVASLLLATMLASCASTYHKNAPFIGGYGETKIDDSHYVVYYNGNNKNSKDHVADFWLYRCAQLTVEKGFTYFSIEPITSNMNNTGFIPDQGGHAYAAVLAGNADGQMIDVHGGGGGGGMIFVPGGTIVIWRSRAVVAMYGDTPPRGKALLRAQSVLDVLADYIATNGSSTPPDHDTILQQSVYAVAPNNQVVNVHAYFLAHVRQPVAPVAPVVGPYVMAPAQGAMWSPMPPAPPAPPPPPPTEMARTPVTPVAAPDPVIAPAPPAAPIDAGTPMAQTVAHQLGCGMVHPNGDSTYVAPCGSYSVVIRCDGDQCHPMHTINAKSDD